MHRSLPPRPNAEQLRKRAKELLRALCAGDGDALHRARATRFELPARLRLHDAQTVLAREYGFRSWRRLIAHVERVTLVGLTLEQKAERFLKRLTAGAHSGAQRILDMEPHVAAVDIFTAAATGEAARVAQVLRRDPSVVRATAGPRRWTPLLFACSSPLHRTNVPRARGILESARLLLASGADPNASYVDPDRPESPLSALFCAIRVGGNNDLVRLLLDSGAEPDDDESLYHAAELSDPTALTLLLDRGAAWRGTNVLLRALDFGDYGRVKLLLEYGVGPNETTPNALHHAILRGRQPEILQLLVDYGADVEGLDSRGHTLHQAALRYGSRDVRRFLAEHGLDTPPGDEERFLAACTAGDLPDALRWNDRLPGIVERLHPEDTGLIAHAAWEGNLEAVHTMVAVGFPLDARGGDGGTPLHCASHCGHREVVRLLLDHGASVIDRGDIHRNTPLEWAVHGSLNADIPGGDYAGVVQALLDAGSPVPERVYAAPEVAELLVRYGAEEVV